MENQNNLRLIGEFRRVRLQFRFEFQNVLDVGVIGQSGDPDIVDSMANWALDRPRAGYNLLSSAKS